MVNASGTPAQSLDLLSNFPDLVRREHGDIICDIIIDHNRESVQWG